MRESISNGKSTKVEAKVTVCFSAVFERDSFSLSYSLTLSFFSRFSWRPFAERRETPLARVLPCVSNEFTWRPTVYLRHFLRLYANAYVCVRMLASMWAEIPCSGRCWTIFPWPLRDMKLGMIIPYLPPRDQGRIIAPAPFSSSSSSSSSSFNSFVSFFFLASSHRFDFYRLQTFILWSNSMYRIYMYIPFYLPRKNILVRSTNKGVNRKVLTILP